MTRRGVDWNLLAFVWIYSVKGRPRSFKGVGNGFWHGWGPKGGSVRLREFFVLEIHSKGTVLPQGMQIVY